MLALLFYLYYNIQIIIPPPDTLYLRRFCFHALLKVRGSQWHGRNRLQQSIQLCARNIAVPNCQCLVIGNDANGRVRTYTQPRCAFNNPKPLTFIGQHRFQPPVHSGKCSQEILLHGRIAVIIVSARCQQTRQQDDKQTTAMFFHTYLPRKLLQFHSDARKKHHLVAAR